MRESAVERKLVAAMQKIGGMCIKINAQGSNGMPDRLCLFAGGGHMVFVELKRPKGGRLSAVQKEQHRRLAACGADVEVVSTPMELDELMAWYCTPPELEAYCAL